ncbi:extracellular solute-binding protein [Streptomyces sp. 8L]|uniref:extracellular solute-binding protein n=1 Tax=Streptomyces sp. 8L TaxID=2877242 RepID=UPI001CD2F079|nr:extracellular solute-binding protein [Streptomyces sp. 8L]MCA1218213.1 extracellular solute-binding protein [Streptomyces sp. 8L]
MSPTAPVDRRTLLRLGAGLGLALAAGPALAACGDGAIAAEPEAKSDALLPRTSVRNIGLRPDLPGTASGVPQGFFRYPARLLRATRGKPLKGASPIKAATETFLPPPPQRSDNPAWRAIEDLLGGRVDVVAVPSDDYPTRFSTMIAGGALPDIFEYPETGGVDNKVAFFDAECADLTPHLAGDAVRDYPNLAAIPKAAWQDAIFGNKLYGIPISRTGTGGAGFYRHDLFARAGVTDLGQITGLDRFVELCKELTRPSRNEYAIMAGATNLVAMSAGAPKDWRFEAATGKFTHRLETPEFRHAVEILRGLYKAGCFYPGTIGMSGAQKSKYTDLFKSGKAAYVYDGMPDYLTPGTGYLDAMSSVDPSFDTRPMVPFGPHPLVWADNISLSNVHIKKASGERVRQLLAFADFAAAPFGSTEYTLINYGVEGTDFRRDAHGNPVLTDKGVLDTATPWKFFGSAVPAVFSPTSEKGVRYAHAAFAEMIPRMAEDPTLAYSSPTWDSKGNGSLLSLEGDGIKDLITGRKPMSWFAQLAKEYLRAGGEKARAEFEEAAQKGAHT